MKHLLLVLLLLSFFCCSAQNNNANTVLLLRKNGASNVVELKIKANKPIKIKNADGEKFRFINFSIIGDSVLVSSTDTVALRNITSIKGKLKGSALRKVSGGLLAGTGYYFAAAGYLAGTIALYPPAYLLILPSAGIAYAGHYVSGARYFDTTGKWALSISRLE